MTLQNPYVLALLLVFAGLSKGHSITLYSQASGTWAPTGGTAGLFNDDINGLGTAYDGAVTTWQGATVDIVVQTGHTIIFQHSSFEIGNLTIELGGKIFTNDDNGFFNYILDIKGSAIHVDGKLGNGVPIDPAKADRIGLFLQGGNITGSGELTIRELAWAFQTTSLKLAATLNIHMYYVGNWDTFYLYNNLGSGTVRQLTVAAGGHLNVYGHFAADFDLRNSNTSSTNATDFMGKLVVDGSMTITEGNLNMKTDNSVGQDFTIAINATGSLSVENSILGNGGVGDPNPYPGAGIVTLDVTGTLETFANDPILYTSARSVVNMNNAGSVFKLSGGANQLLDDDVLGARFYDVELAGTGPKALEGSTGIDNTLTLGAGHLQLGNNNLTMTKTFMVNETNNTIINAGPSQFIETNGAGTLKAHMPAGDFFGPGYLTLPIGKTTYNAVTFQSYGLVGDFMEARVADQVLSNGTSGTPKTSHTLNKTWFIDEDVPGGSSISLELTWTILDQSVDFNQSKTYISHYSSGAWDTDIQYPGGKATASASSGVYTVTRNGANDFSPFTVFSLPAVALPVEWLAFSATAQAKTVALDWTTAWEENNKHFIIEHSTDAKQFQPIGTLAGQNTSDIAHDYQFVHTSPALGLNYYRIKQVDYSDEYSYSKILSVNFNPANGINRFSFYPNPTQQLLLLSGPLDHRYPVQLKLLNALGQEVALFLDIQADSPIDIGQLTPGTYTGILEVGKEFHSIQFIKE